MVSVAAAVPKPVTGYEILSVLGKGGMGIVYKALHLKLNRIVALKMVLRAEHATPAELARFLTEAEAVTALKHANIVQIYDIGTHDGLPYFTLEFMEGGSLADKVRDNPLPPREAAALVEQVTRGVQCAHDRGIVHRDLKPENVLLAADGTPKVTDFGLAKRLDSGSGLTQTGAIMGTPSYMAPEQAAAKTEITPAADVWALGAILYRLLTGRPPFQAATHLDTILQVMSEEPVPPARMIPKLPRDLNAVTLKCLQKEQANRYISATALADDLRRFLAGEAVHARTVTWVERGWKAVKRRPTLALLLFVSLIAFANSGFAGRFAILTLGSVGGGTALLAVGVFVYRAITTRLRQANERLQLARQIVGDLYLQVARRWVTNEDHGTDLRRAFLLKTLDLFETLADERARDPSVKRWAALAHFHVGQVFHQALGDAVEAEHSYARAIAIQEQLRQEHPLIVDYGRDLADNLEAQATLLMESKLRLQEAEQLRRRAKAMWERSVAESHSLLTPA